MHDDDGIDSPDVRQQVRQVWLSILPKGTSGSFAEAGGDSLSGLRLIGAIYKTLGLRVPFDDLTAAVDLEDFADRVARRAAERG